MPTNVRKLFLKTDFIRNATTHSTYNFIHKFLYVSYNLYHLLFMNKWREIPRLDITFKVVEIKYTNVWQYISSFERQICCWLMVFYIIASSFLLRQGKQNSLVVAFFTPIAHTPSSCFNINLIRIIYECIQLSEISFLNVKLNFENHWAIWQCSSHPRVCYITPINKSMSYRSSA